MTFCKTEHFNVQPQDDNKKSCSNRPADFLFYILLQDVCRYARDSNPRTLRSYDLIRGRRSYRLSHTATPTSIYKMYRFHLKYSFFITKIEDNLYTYWAFQKKGNQILTNQSGQNICLPAINVILY